MDEFLRELEECLRGEVPDAECRESLEYYRDYYREQKNQGMSEQEISASLGSPRLIAKSIIDARGNVEDAPQETGYYDMEEETYQSEEESLRPRTNGLGWLKTALIVAVVFLLLGSVVRLFLPIAIFVIPIFIIFNLFRRDR